MEHSHVPLHKWLLALFMVTKCERYLSPQKLKRELGLGFYRTAWLMAQRIRDALSQYRRELDRTDAAAIQCRIRRTEANSRAHAAKNHGPTSTTC